jgi:hypothetical protein
MTSQKEEISFSSLEELRRMFPKLAVLSNSKVVLMTEDQKMSIEIDPDSEEAKTILTEVDYRMITSAKERFNIVPENLKNKFCLLFCGRVWESADTLAEIEMLKFKYPHMLMTVYMPNM